MDEQSRPYNLGVIEDMESTLLPDNHTVKARGVWLMDGEVPTLFFDSIAVSNLQNELSEVADERDARGNILNHAIERAESLHIHTGNSWYQAIDRMHDEIVRLRKTLGISLAQNQRLNEGIGDVIGDGSYPYGCPDQANMIHTANTAIMEAKALEDDAEIVMPPICPDCGKGVLLRDTDERIEFEECAECGYRRNLAQHFSDGSKCDLTEAH